MSELPDDLSETNIRFIVETVRDALRNDRPTPQPGLVRLPEDDRLRSIVGDILERKLSQFEKRVEAIVRTEIETSLRRIGLRIDDAHIDQTAEEFRSMIRTHRNVNRLVTGLGITLVTGMFFGLLKLLGLNLGAIVGEH
ncbi:protein of unknown function [Beijerinckiaceae bacterium RH AL1]|nr:hypothetical protein [Beijerinckiaceae bacterium]VVB44049.1 protein of unknown function [Beijerinckiaceae bacterium RH CH11]VVB44076.1 protein of unknown function [Beijerinckiaceae bacterium RH AL8]VVC54145.1 protein of unknown function [Beijerinckiaceae bacterium RH AL1]